MVVGKMDKSEDNKAKDKLAHFGKVWIHDPEKNVRTSSGVRFGGKYISLKEYLSRHKGR